jgi:hypothetical protein
MSHQERYTVATVTEKANIAIAGGQFPTKQAQKDALALLSRCYEVTISSPLCEKLRGDNYGELSFWDVPHNLHQFSKKAKELFAHEDFSYYVKKIEELQVLRESIKALPIIKPATKASMVNLNKDMKTCPCCFRTIAVQKGVMAHHGYTRPGHGHITASCMGISFAPYEVSDEGTKAFLTVLEHDMASAQEELSALPTQTTLLYRDMMSRQVSPITQGDPKFKKTYDITQSNLESKIRHLTQLAGFMKDKINSWEMAA